MDLHQPLDTRAYLLMLLLCTIWSLQQITLKATAADFSPTLQLALRSGIAALLVWGMMRWRGEQLTVRDGIWKPGLAVGALFAFEFLLIGKGLQYTTAGHMIVLLYSAPIFAALGLHWKLPSERLSPLQWLGILLAFAGIAVAFLGHGTDTNLEMLIGDLLAVGAAILWAATTVTVRTTRLATLPATQVLFYQLAAAFVLLLPGAWLIGHTTLHIDVPMVWAALAFQALAVSFFSYLVWFWLLRFYLASRLGVLSFLSPLLGVVLGAWLLDEPIERNFMIGAAMVLVGIVLVSGHAWLQQVLTQRRT
ncbi:MAG: DMT family transporter [Ramlibacter sp.]|nr:DMT family transporter [Ramlibacter sp.]